MASIVTRKRRKRGYEYRFEIASINGVRKWYQKSGFRTKAEAEKAGAEALTKYNNGGVPFKPRDMSYADYLDYWIDNYCMKSLAYNTYSTYETLVRLYIKPKMGMYRLAAIQSTTITDFINGLVEEHNFSRSYYKNILKVVKASFVYAVNYGFLKDNPAKESVLPIGKYKKRKTKHIYSQEEIDTILERFKNNQVFICAFLTACYTGMRTGEVLALTWDDINFDEGTIRVNHSVYDKPKDSLGRWYMGETKTEAGMRTIPLGDTLKKTLLNYKRYQDFTKELYASDYKKYGLRDIEVTDDDVMLGRIVESKYGEYDLDFVFTREDGTYSGTNITKYPYSIIRGELNIDCRFYDLRGTFATRTYHGGVKEKDIANILGHSSIEITDEHYISAIDEAVVKAINKMNKLISSDTINKVIQFE